jgi:4-amino-4-deoxy-L-arabinose transferase-like glycosyltransferase
VRARHAAGFFLILSLILSLAALTARAIVALGTDQVLDWDETYYASTASTAAHGLGFYPHVLGYPPIPHMGGLGYVVCMYVLAYDLFGPHLLGLRLLSFIVSLLGVAGLSVLTRRQYGSAAGLATLALTPSLLIFQLSNTIRLDIFAVAFVAWALVLYSYVAERQEWTIGWHLLAGFVFALGLQVHLHTAAAAIAVGLACVVNTIGAHRRDGTRLMIAAKPTVGYAAGYAAGVLLFVAVNVLPDPQAFFRTAALARLSAADSQTSLNLAAPMDLTRLAQTFLSPAMIVPKEIVRYSGVFADMSWWEGLIWLLAVPAYLLRRRTSGAFRGGALLAGAVLGGGMVFNSSSPLYSAAILPFFVPAAATLVTHGFGSKVHVSRADVPGSSVVLLLLLSVAILPGAVSRTGPAMARLRQPETPTSTPAIVARVTKAATPDCILAGPTDLYAQYFMAYPKFVGTRQVEVLIGSTYYDLQDRVVSYWYEKNPDIVFGTPDEGLRAYLAQAKYVTIAEGVWRKPDHVSAGCRIRVR